MELKITEDEVFKNIILTDRQGILEVKIYTDIAFRLFKAKRKEDYFSFSVEKNNEYFKFFYEWYRKLDDTAIHEKSVKKDKYVFKGEAGIGFLAKNDTMEISLTKKGINFKFLVDKTNDVGKYSEYGSVIIAGHMGGSKYKDEGLYFPSIKLRRQIKEYEDSKELIL